MVLRLQLRSPATWIGHMYCGLHVSLNVTFPITSLLTQDSLSWAMCCWELLWRLRASEGPDHAQTLPTSRL